MAKYFITLGLFLVSVPNNVFGQELTPIQLDRPDQTECPFITPKKYIQIENGFNIEQSEKGIQNFSFPTSLWKYGINDKLEFRLITEFATENYQTGLKPITLGFKTSLLEENGIIPKTSFIGHITTSKLGSKEFQTTYIAPSFRFTMQHTLSKKVTLAYNLGVEWNGETPNQTYLYTLTTGYSLSEKIGCYAEIFGYFTKERNTNHNIDGGLTYLVSNNFIVDLSGGIGITKNSPKNYLSIGISYRFKISK